MILTDTQAPILTETTPIQDSIYEKVPFTPQYDTHITIDESNTEEWGLKSMYIQRDLKNMGIFPEADLMESSDSALVGYTYPRASSLETGLFFTNRTVEKNMMVGLPGCGGEGANDRPYFGILVHKDNNMEVCISYGNHVCKPIRIPLKNTTDQETQSFVKTILGYWEPVKAL
jgi:hypothetical protein